MSQNCRSFVITWRVSSIQPFGRSSLRPPMRSKFGWKRPPVAPSIRLSTYSRSRKARNTGVTAPICTPRSPRNSADVGDPGQLEQDRADHLGARRRLDAHQLLAGEDERHLVGEAAEPVDAVDERRHLRERADLGELFVPAVHVAGNRFGPHDLLAVEAADDAQRAVGGRVLRADVEGHALRLELDVQARVGRLAGDVASCWRSVRLVIRAGFPRRLPSRRRLRRRLHLRTPAWARRRRCRARA